MAGEPLPDDLELLRRLMAEASAFLDYTGPIIGEMNAVAKDYREAIEGCDPLDLEDLRERLAEDRRILNQARHKIRQAPPTCNLLRRHLSENCLKEILDIRRRLIIKILFIDSGVDAVEFDQKHPHLMLGKNDALSVLANEVRQLQTEIAAKIEATAAKGKPGGKGGRKRRNEERNALVMAEVRAGTKHVIIRKNFDLTCDQLKGIIRQARKDEGGSE